MLAIIVFVISLAVLIYSAKLVTDSASHFARVLGASEFIVGATVVALGTSLPELSSSIQAMQSGLTEVVIGNVVGSNIANIALILGATSIFYIVKTDRDILKLDIPFFLTSAVATLVVLMDLSITLPEGIILIIMYLGFLSNSVMAHRKHGGRLKMKLDPLQILCFVFGLAGLVYGATYLISSSVDLMSAFGISEAVIGFILIAIGTSLPEFATSIVAARQGKIDMLIGDIIGSNSFNSLIVLGASSFVGDITGGSAFIWTALPLMLLLSFFLTYVVYDKKITRYEGIALLSIYLIILTRIIVIS